ncbi:MAG: PDDEXK nuclease domain-containing protein [Lactobacillales bacterium]|jgi:predicted nuclease of restriction endonuclease-like (RecB) superfamily|nr:PDDEXK nuclease domain-containing protein [Lactobacillales bacterium]
MNKIESNETEFFYNVARLINDARSHIVKTVNSTMVITYYEIGRRIVEKEQKGADRAEYGQKLIKGMSTYLTEHLGRGFSITNLKQMKKFYLIYSSNQKGQLLTDLFEPAISWTHYVQLMRITNIDERSFYEQEISSNNWTIKEFQRQFDSALYERLVLSKDKEKVSALSQIGQIIESPVDIIKDPYILEFLNLPEHSNYSESELEQEIIDHLQEFMLELGKGFSFVARQERFTFAEDSFFVDLVFYNRLLRCFVLVDLKIGKITPQDAGQMQLYVNYYDREVIVDSEHPTIGIILCKNKNDSVVKMMLPEDNKQIFASKYETVLPTKEQLLKLLND